MVFWSPCDRGQHEQAVQHGEELAIDEAAVALDGDVQGLFVVDEASQAHERLGLGALAAQHLGRDALELPQALDEAFPVRVFAGLEHVAPARFGRQLAHEHLGQVADHLLALHFVQPDGGHVDAQEFVSRVCTMSGALRGPPAPHEVQMAMFTCPPNRAGPSSGFAPRSMMLKTGTT